MQQKTLWIFSLAVLLSCGGCASLTAPPPQKSSAPPLEKIFENDLETVWRAIQLAMKKYPVQINDQESGIFETQFIRGEKAWISPPRTELPSGGQRYKISIRALKGKTSVQSTQVSILKRAEIQRDFFSEVEKEPSDGLEEASIMYRIEREIAIEKALQKLKK